MSSLDMSLCKGLCLLDPTCRRVVFIDPTCRRVVFIRSSLCIAPLFWLSGGWWVFQTLFGPRVFHATWCSGNLD